MREFQAEIKLIKTEAENVKTFSFPKPEEFSFQPGQYCWLSLPTFDPSPMAIASGQNDDVLEFTIRAWGELTEELFRRKKGTKVTIDGPYGTYFPTERLEDNEILQLIAGGTGITPIRSLVRSVGSEHKIDVFYGAKTPEELLYLYEFDQWPASVNLTVDEKNGNWDGHVGLVTSLLEKETLAPDALYFVCGPLAMEKAVVKYLREQDVPSKDIYVSLERFDDEGNVVGPVLPVTDNEIEF